MKTLSLVYTVVCSLLAQGVAFSAPELAPDLFSQVKEILSERCLSCHNTDSKQLNGGNLSLETYADILKGGNSGSSLTPKHPAQSLLYTTLTLPESERLAMPPAGRFKRVPKAEIETIKQWIAQGAVWPEGETIHAHKSTPSGDSIDPAEMELVLKIREKILNQASNIQDPETQDSESKHSESYTDRIENVRATLKMIPIPKGSVQLKGTEPDDVFTAHLNSFWMAEKEISWDLYQPFMEPKIVRNKDGYPQDDSEVEKGDIILAQPSEPYHAMSFGMGVRRHPAIAMTQHAANKYCQWLSWQTGHFYRLPTEAEWEYAARAGMTTSAPEHVEAWAWYNDNSNGSYQRLGKKQPNAWGLYDMLGNVMEWTLDGFVRNRKHALGGKDEVSNPWIRATGPYPHVCKGGHWNADLSELTYSGRTPSSPQWKISDPQSPKSIWYHTSIMWIGFRPVRPTELPSAEDMYRYWNSGVAYD